MSSYKIKPYTYQQAKKLGVEVKPSGNPSKKIDVFKDGVKIASVGAANYSDLPTWMETHGKEYALERRRLYKLRHAKDRNKVGTPGFWADRLLW